MISRLTSATASQTLQASSWSTPRKRTSIGGGLFEAYSGLAFGDATVAAYMERENIECLYSFDDDFEAIENITRLETADNPFN